MQHQSAGMDLSSLIAWYKYLCVFTFYSLGEIYEYSVESQIYRHQRC